MPSGLIELGAPTGDQKSPGLIADKTWCTRETATSSWTPPQLSPGKLEFSAIRGRAFGVAATNLGSREIHRPSDDHARPKQ